MNDAKRGDDKEVFESHCGVGSCRPQALQCLKNVLSFSIFFGLAAMITQSLGIYIVSQITALEKQFNLSSTATGIILSCNDIGFLCAVLFISHFGSYGHIPRVISLSTILFGVSGILASLCYFFDPYQLPKLSTEDVRNSSLDHTFVAPLCDQGNTTSHGCGEEGVASDTGSAQWIVWFFGISMVLQGIGKSPRVSLSTTYIDDNNPIKTKSGLYIGISATMTLFGPAIAIALGGVFRTIPVDLQDLPRSMFRVLRSPVYSLSLVGILFLKFHVAGSQAFTSKYAEKQFMVPASRTNIILGIQSLISLSVGTFTGGLLTSRLKLTRAGCLKLILLSQIVASLATVVMVFLGCDTPQILGFHDKERIITFDDGIRLCSCDSTSYFPVCGDDGMTYFSPCFAGCTNQTLSMYGGCSKVTSGQTTAGACVSDCPYFYYYIAADMIQKLIGTMSILPIYLILIRSVEGRDKATAFGLFTFLSSLLGYLPAPIVFGYIIDSACLIWERPCGVSGACGQYNLESLRVRLKAVESALKVAALIFFGVALIVLKLQGGNKPTEETLELTRKTDKKMESSAK
ncbi:solute carrier organic anion transporter family member 3A1-like [Haliotis rubra]|uniref:solute carrier organic anion transporter family member 3A1-like n=1 Tax=Haliotis rubra TaxID=36100 RepID=UPI001EE5F06A|nr:solute carrier organic anion transporter family member 3A1-like [Haliotis rubra]